MGCRLDSAALSEQVDHQLRTLFHVGGLGVDHQVRIQRYIVGDGFARDVVKAGCVEALRIALAARQRRRLYIDGDQAIGTDEGLGLFAAFANEGLRRRWLPGTEVAIRSVSETKLARVARGEVVGHPGRLTVSFEPKGPAKATVALAQEKLPDAATAAAMKALWKDGLAALKQLLEEG